MTSVRILIGDARRRLHDVEDRSVQLVVSSPPYYGLRDYGTGEWRGGDAGCDHLGAPLQSRSSTLKGNGHGGAKPLSPSLQAQAQPFGARCGKCGAERLDDQIGLEETPEEYVEALVALMRIVRDKLRDDGLVFLNLGDSYAGSWGAQGNIPNMRRGGAPKVKSGAGKIRGRGLKPKDLIGIPWLVAFALRADGWYLRQDVVWSKSNPMPESVLDRCTKSHEFIFMLSKSGKPTIWQARDTKAWSSKPISKNEMMPNPSKNPEVVARRPMVKRWRAFDYYFDQAAIAEEAIYQPGGSHDDVVQGGFDDKGVIPGTNQRSFRAIRETRNKRSVWTMATVPLAEAHFAAFPPELATTCILAGSPAGALVLDPFGGAGTTALVAARLGRSAVLCELNPEYALIMERRLRDDGNLLLDLSIESESRLQREAAA